MLVISDGTSLQYLMVQACDIWWFEAWEVWWYEHSISDGMNFQYLMVQIFDIWWYKFSISDGTNFDIWRYELSMSDGMNFQYQMVQTFNIWWYELWYLMVQTFNIWWYKLSISDGIEVWVSDGTTLVIIVGTGFGRLIVQSSKYLMVHLAIYIWQYVDGMSLSVCSLVHLMVCM